MDILRLSYIVVGGLLVHVVLSKADKSICFTCSRLDDPKGCKEFNECRDGERCFKLVAETENGTAAYSWGCASAQLCTLENSSAGRRKRLSVDRCYDCCDGNFCNFGPCTNDYCSEVHCEQGASCTNTALKAVCNCPAGYTGQICETEIDECSSNPCMNGATCTDYVARYTCTCPAGFTGVNCEININECVSDPCQYGATCVDQVNGFTCTCVVGFTGNLCETNINDCAADTCKYNSTCVDLVNGYRCVCPEGITGHNCEININECENVTCQNGGHCVDYINVFQCVCELGFDGVYCQNVLGRVCYNCQGVNNVSACTKRTICAKGEECYMEHELTSPGAFNFNLGCIPVQMCKYITPDIRRQIRPVQLCYECCDRNGCNHHACADTRGQNATNLDGEIG